MSLLNLILDNGFCPSNFSCHFKSFGPFAIEKDDQLEVEPQLSYCRNHLKFEVKPLASYRQEVPQLEV